MADKPKGDAAKDLRGVIFVFVLIALAWFFTGGYNHPISFQGPWLNPITNIGGDVTGYGPQYLSNSNQTSQNNLPADVQKESPNVTGNETYTIKQTYTQIKDNIADSIYKDEIYLYSGGATYNDPQQEYLEISASSNNKNKILITGWRVKSAVSGQSYDIGNGVYLPYIGQVNSDQAIYLNPGEKAIISTGKSPTGYSFKENKCTGYFQQFQSYTPSLSYSCPAPRDEYIPPDPHGFNNACLDFINSIPACQTNTKPFTFDLPPACQDFINQNVSYSGCVRLHKDDPDFDSVKTWRIYLGRDKEIWSSRREVIELIDNTGHIVDAVSY